MPALAVVGLFNAGTSFLVQFVFPWELASLGNAATFFVYSGFGVVALVLLGWLLPETKGKSLEELEADLGQARPGNFNAEEMRKKIAAMNP